MSDSFKQLFEATQQALRENPDAAKATFTAASRQVEGLKSEVTTRQFTFAVDEPSDLGGTDTGPNPVEYVLAALATCQEITYRLYADKLGIPLDGVSVDLEGGLDLRGFFAVDDNIRPGFRSVSAVVRIDSPASEADIARLRETVDAHCPVLDILRNVTPVGIEVAHNEQASQAA
jgi:uncharacterized OsmC-like protein